MRQASRKFRVLLLAAVFTCAAALILGDGPWFMRP
jgi:hypothetical protein